MASWLVAKLRGGEMTGQHLTLELINCELKKARLKTMKKNHQEVLRVNVTNFQPGHAIAKKRKI